MSIDPKEEAARHVIWAQAMNFNRIVLDDFMTEIIREIMSVTGIPFGYIFGFIMMNATLEKRPLDEEFMTEMARFILKHYYDDFETQAED